MVRLDGCYVDVVVWAVVIGGPQLACCAPGLVCLFLGEAKGAVDCLDGKVLLVLQWCRAGDVAGDPVTQAPAWPPARSARP